MSNIKCPKHKAVQHFVPGQVLLVVEHSETSSGDLIRKLINQEDPGPSVLKLQDVLTNDIACNRKETYREDQIVTFRGDDNNPTFSLVVAKLRDVESISPGGIDTANTEVTNIVQEFFEYSKQKEKDADDVRVVSVTPNWFGAPTSTGAATGGPGGIPVPPDSTISVDTDMYFFECLSADMINHALSVQENDEIQAVINDSMNGVLYHNVEVAILDTVPPEADIQRAYRRFVTDREAQGERAHPLLKQLFEPGAGVLEITRSQHIEADLLGYKMVDHAYKMTDHGLFAAGTISTLAPGVKLHLIEVLNEYGIGSVASVARGLNIAINRRKLDPQSPLLINLSLVFTLPLRGHGGKEHLPQKFVDELETPRTGYGDVDETTDFIEYLMQPVEYIRMALMKCKHMDSITADGILLIAAAGNDNDGKPPRDRPATRYPAALDPIIGVGAWKRDNASLLTFKPTDYSNRSDRPLSEGIAVFGGNKNGDKSDVMDGMLGVYISEYFPPDPLECEFDEAGNPIPASVYCNDRGWARWAGTSFAAPVITGILAALRAKGKNALEAWNIVKRVVQSTNPSTECFLNVDQKH